MNYESFLHIKKIFQQSKKKCAFKNLLNLTLICAFSIHRFVRLSCILLKILTPAYNVLL